jgi:UDP-N-acetylmuramoyl-L-alanyl-D-glutamate--2,6-diaminopimelate ligase
MVKDGITHAVIEVTAHALDQYRFFGCHFFVSGITNTSHEHLDDFLDMSQYINTKAKLFSHSEIAILNADDPSYKSISKNIKTKLLTFGIDKSADYRANNVSISPEQLSFTSKKYKFITDSNYRYQIYNILLTQAILDQLGIDPTILISIIKSFPIMKGRREIVNNDIGVQCIIDFAHTPAALESTLSSLKLTTTGKLIVIFGATGGRDPSKRPIMGNVVSKLSDIAIVTADDTRNELVENINKQIISGMDKTRIDKKQFIYHDIPRRQDAFNLAVKLASPGDTIIACGKGHETTILHGKTEYPWSERDAFLTAFRQIEV